MPTRIKDGLSNWARYYRRLTPAKKEARLLRVVKWRADNPDRRSAIDRASYAKHAVKRRAESVVASKARRQRIVGTAAYRAAERARTQRRRATLLGLATTLTTKEWQDILEAHNHRCAYCRATPAVLEQDHVVPISKGGAHTKDNVVPACKPCNSSKRDRVAPLRCA